MNSVINGAFVVELQVLSLLKEILLFPQSTSVSQRQGWLSLLQNIGLGAMLPCDLGTLLVGKSLHPLVAYWLSLLPNIPGPHSHSCWSLWMEPIGSSCNKPVSYL